MAAEKHENIEEIANAVRNGVGGFTAEALARLAQSPDAVVSALAVAADALGTSPAPWPSGKPRRPAPPGHDRGRAVERLRGAPPTYVDAEEATARLDARTVARTADEELLSTEEAATLLRLKGGRQSVHVRLKKRELISFEGGTRNVLIPRRQFDAHGRPLPGIAEVRTLFPDGHSAWSWLTTPSAALGGSTPLERLERGEVREVVARARGYCQGDFT